MYTIQHKNVKNYYFKYFLKEVSSSSHLANLIKNTEKKLWNLFKFYLKLKNSILLYFIFTLLYFCDAKLIFHQPLHKLF